MPGGRIGPGTPIPKGGTPGPKGGPPFNGGGPGGGRGPPAASCAMLLGPGPGWAAGSKPAKLHGTALTVTHDIPLFKSQRLPDVAGVVEYSMHAEIRLVVVSVAA